MTQVNPRHIRPLHDVEDQEKAIALADAMRRDGWQGAPIVIADRSDGIGLAITGTHRLAAARAAGIDVPTIGLADLLAEHGMDLDAMVAERARWVDETTAIYDAAICAVDELPDEVRNRYGLDLAGSM